MSEQIKTFQNLSKGCDRIAYGKKALNYSKYA